MPVFSRGETHVLFVHVPKTGGTALERCFEEAGFATSWYDATPAQRAPVRRVSRQHLHAALLTELLRVEAFASVFTVVRHPFDRLRSEFAFRRGRGVEGPLRPLAVERWGLRKLAQTGADASVNDNHFRPQWEFVVPGSTVFRYEDGLAAAVETLNAQHGLDLPTPRRRNDSSETGLASRDVPLSPRLRSALTEHYRRDFEEFGYDPGSGQ